MFLFGCGSAVLCFNGFAFFRLVVKIQSLFVE